MFFIKMVVVMSMIVKDTTSSLEISWKICDQKPNQIAPLSTEGDPIHCNCVISSLTKYPEPLNGLLSWMISPSVETCSIWFFFITDSGEKCWCKSGANSTPSNTVNCQRPVRRVVLFVGSKVKLLGKVTPIMQTI